MKENDWKDESLCLAVSRGARIICYGTFQELARKGVNTVGDAIRYGSLNMKMEKGFGKRLHAALADFIRKHDSALASSFENNETGEAWCMEGYNYLTD